MFSLEDKLRPPNVENPWPRDVLGVGLLIAVALILHPNWHAHDDWELFMVDVAGQMASFYLLPALGFCLALRCGAVDLSVWAVASLAGLVGAWLINAGAPPAWAFAAGCAAGLAVGCLNAAMVTFLRLPSPAVTFAIALAIMFSLQAAAGRSAAVPDDAFSGWHLPTARAGSSPDAPPAPTATDMEPAWHSILVTRVLIVAAGYAAVMLVLLAADTGGRGAAGRRGRLSLFSALAASGLLCGLAGVCWLMEHKTTPVPRRPIGDLRVVSAALLAGAVFFAGRGRALLVGLCLPPAMLIATRWRQEVWAWNMDLAGYAVQSLQLAAMLLGTHLAMAHLLSKKPRPLPPALAALALTAGGTLTTACIALADEFRTRAVIYAAGLGLWCCGVALLAAAKLPAAFRARREHAPHDDAP